MQIVLKNGIVVAIHADGQDLKDAYPDCTIGSTRQPCEVTDPDPRTPAELQAVYLDNRRLAYPSLEDQLDMLYWDQMNRTTVWRDTITAIKKMYPNPANKQVQTVY